MAVLPPHHPYASAAHFPVEQLLHETFIRLKEYTDNEISLYFQNCAIHPKLAYEVSDDYAILSMVESGLGVSLLHDLVADTNRFQIIKNFGDPFTGEGIFIACLRCRQNIEIFSTLIFN